MSATLGDEGYQLTITETMIRIVAGHEKGVFYGVQSLIQMLPMDGGREFELPTIEIVDQPEYGWRGFMFDEARHFFGKETVKKILDWMAAYKMNRFHWHLTDDQGWRIEIEAFPLLTEIGSKRSRTKMGTFFGKGGYINETHEGFYTQEDIKEIVAYAKQRQIDVIPEFDIPGHFSTVLAAYPEFGCSRKRAEVKDKNGIFKEVACVSNPETIDFIKTVIDELCELFPFPFMHIGGDEVKTENWENCSACTQLLKDKGLSSYHELQVWFANQIAAHLREKRRTSIVWNEVTHPELAEDIMLLHWISKGKGFKKTVHAVNSGRKALMQTAPVSYFDYPYAMAPLRKINQLNPRKNIDSAASENIMGVQCALWTEFVNNEKRIEFNCFPRMALIAEIGWETAQPDDVNSFIRRWKKSASQRDLLGLKNAAPIKAANPKGIKQLYLAIKSIFFDMRFEEMFWQK